LRAVAAAALLAGTLVAPAFAATATATVTGGSLTMGTVADPTVAATLGGIDQIVHFDIPVTVTDATGSGLGWNLTISASTFTGTGTTPPTLDPAALAVGAAPAISTTSGTAPTDGVTYSGPLTVTSGGVKYFSATAGTGMGDSTETATMNLAIPAATKADAYTSTVTVAILSAP